MLNSPLGGAKTPRNEEAGLADFMAAKQLAACQTVKSTNSIIMLDVVAFNTQ